MFLLLHIDCLPPEDLGIGLVNLSDKSLQIWLLGFVSYYTSISQVTEIRGSHEQ